MNVLVTGSSGHLASVVIPLLKTRGHRIVEFDLPDWSILDSKKLLNMAANADAEFCVHLAGLKYADRAEIQPLTTIDVNVRGTANVINAFGANVVLASTCKAADPETVYGCSKLIAERLVLSAGGRIARLVNVLGSAGSVTQIWQNVAIDAPLPVCDAHRLFIDSIEAARLIVDAVDWPTGRYAPANARSSRMTDIGTVLYPGREQVEIPLRRGDRHRERLLAACEHSEYWTSDTIRIVGAHDPRRD